MVSVEGFCVDSQVRTLIFHDLSLVIFSFGMTLKFENLELSTLVGYNVV